MVEDGNGHRLGLDAAAKQGPRAARASQRSSRTAGGLIFIGTNADAIVRAFDKDNGKVLWEHELEANPEGMAAVYEISGRQYVVFCTSSYDEVADDNIAIFKGKQSAQGYYVFALPQKASR
ncbi:MAG: hypothetical protein ACRD2N_03645 [Vicinamibacterales bacterium]